MHPALEEIPARILFLAKGALAQANMHAAYYHQYEEYKEFTSVLNTAHAGELFLKAIIAKEHPLLLFKDLFSLDDGKTDPLDIDRLIERGKTHDFEKLPQVLWAATGKRVPNMHCFERLRKARNAVQHFCPSDKVDFRQLSLEFIYTIIDPMIYREFGLCAIEFHEDHGISYDYVVQALLQSQLKFTVPNDFDVTEIGMKEHLSAASKGYISWVKQELKRVGRSDLIE
jgi:hypothetical protein